MLFLITRPFVYLFKLLKTIVKAPFKFVGAIRYHNTRKNAKLAARAIKQQNKAAAAAPVAAAGAAGTVPSSPAGTHELVP